MLARLTAAWRRKLAGAPRQALLAAFGALLLGGAHLARIGTLPLRASVAGVLLAILCVALFRWWRERRDLRSIRRTIARVLIASDPAAGARALRALTLLERAPEEAARTSEDLARLHFERVLGAIPQEVVERGANRQLKWWRSLLVVSGTIALGAFALGPLKVLEGLNVLVARDGRAPLPMVWLGSVRTTVQPPAYLRSPERFVFGGFVSEHPAGSTVTVRGVPLHEGRALVLTDGSKEVPFVSDAAGGVIARWTLDRDTHLRIAARFGEVLIEEAEGMELSAVPDTPPRVEVEEAPRTVELQDLERLEIRYIASDDHGLKQIDLVLRAGDREDRRVLSRLDGESRIERGGHALTPRDSFLRRMFMPVEITVEARDNDPLNGPKWGKSAPITIVPPAVGHPEAKRYAALLAARDALVDLLAHRSEPRGTDAEARAEQRRIDRDKLASARRAIDAAVSKSHGGLFIGGGLRAFLVGQAQLLERPLRPGESGARRVEDVLLAVDVAARRLASSDARRVSKRLGDVAEEAANGARQARETERRERGVARLRAAVEVAELGARQLVTLGDLGRDLGSLALSELRRIRRADAAGSLSHAELAARHLAERLRRPEPSFAGGGRGGVESGAGQGGAPGSGEASRAADRFDQLVSELEQLAQEHAGEIDRVDRALRDAEQAVDLDQMRQEAAERAEAVRDAVRPLPQIGADPGSARAAAALAREHGVAMAQSLDRLDMAAAVQSGREAISSLSDAVKKANEGRSPSDWIDTESLGRARAKLEEQLRWAEQALERQKRLAQENARSTLERSGARENEFAQRAGNLAGRGKQGQTALPEEALENLERAELSMQEAARELSYGNAERGLELQREAQRLLERASSGQTDDRGNGDEAGQPDGSGTDGRRIRTGGDVPDKDDRSAAEEFRRRVLRGLGKQEGGKLGPAVRRYAEGLLR